MDDYLGINKSKTDIWGHIGELKKRVVYAILSFIIIAIICYYQAKEIYSFLLKPLMINLAPEHHKIIYTGLAEAFFTYVKLACFAGFFLSFPFIAAQVYIFIAPGLYKKEKLILVPYLVCAPLLFLLGSAMSYYYVFPMAWKFFLSFESAGINNIELPIRFEARISEYLSIVMHLIIAFGLAFQLPVLLTLLCHIGVLSARTLAKKRKLAIVIIFTIAAIITPPDVLSQIALAIPMVLLYEISILACKLVEKSRFKNA